MLQQTGILLGYLIAGVLVTWPRATYLKGLMPATRDQASYAWVLWWFAHQVEHLGNPFTTQYMAAPVGVPLAYHALMPLFGFLLMPVTVTAGAAFAVTLLSVLLPGLAGYAMYRAARLWLAPFGALAAGALFGFSSVYAYRSFFHLNVAAGVLFLPITLEAVIRLRRDPSWKRSAWLGLVIGSCMLVDLESAVLALMVVAAVLVPWLIVRPAWAKVGVSAAAGVVCLLVAAPELIGLVSQASATAANARQLATDYVNYNVALPHMFSPSPRLAAFGLTGLSHLVYDGGTEVMPTFGVTLTALALLGAALGWRRRRERIWLVLWLGVAALALGPVLHVGSRTYIPLPSPYGGHEMSLLMPYTWFVRLPGLAGFREANRFIPLALIPAGLLAGSAVAWIHKRSAPAVLLVAALAVLELGWSTIGPEGRMPTTFPAVDRAIAADRSSSLVVDVPLSIRGGGNKLAPPFPPQALLNAVSDGHPRAIAYVARIPLSTLDALCRHPFYADMLAAQSGARVHAATIPAARADARRMHVGWVIVWTKGTPRLRRYLEQTGFRFRYRGDGAAVYRAADAGRAASSGSGSQTGVIAAPRVHAGYNATCSG